jgi:hypothetical protein
VARALTVRLRPSKGRKPSFCAARRRCFGGGAGLRACGSRPGLREVCGCAFGGGGVRARAQGLGPNVPLICVEGVTGYGAQCLTMEDGIVVQGTWLGNSYISASGPYTHMSRVRNFSKCVFLKDLRVDTVKKFGLDADLVADWHRLQALKQATKLAHPIPEDGTA